MDPDTWKGREFEPSKILVSDLLLFLAELNDVTKISPLLKTTAREENKKI